MVILRVGMCGRYLTVKNMSYLDVRIAVNFETFTWQDRYCDASINDVAIVGQGVVIDVTIPAIRDDRWDRKGAFHCNSLHLGNSTNLRPRRAAASDGVTTITRPVGTSVAARSIPWLISPRICRDTRLATTTICFPTID